MPGLAVRAAGLSLSVEVTYTGRDRPAETFWLEWIDPAGQMTRQSARLEEDTSATVTFDVPSDEEGTHRYTLRERAGDTLGVTYSSREYVVTVKVTGDGTAVVTAADSETGQKPDVLRFDNTYTAPGVTTGDPPVSVRKRVAGDRPAQPTLFIFTMKPEREGDPLPPGGENGKKEVYIRGEGEVEIGDILFTRPDVYRYSITEREDGAPGYSYDRTIFTVIYTVTEQNGTLHCQRQMLREGEEPVTACDFTNVYTAPESPQTGDDSHLWIHVVMAACSAAGIAVLLVRWRREAAAA